MYVCMYIYYMDCMYVLCACISLLKTPTTSTMLTRPKVFVWLCMYVRMYDLFPKDLSIYSIVCTLYMVSILFLIIIWSFFWLSITFTDTSPIIGSYFLATFIADLFYTENGTNDSGESICLVKCIRIHTMHILYACTYLQTYISTYLRYT